MLLAPRNMLCLERVGHLDYLGKNQFKPFGDIMQASSSIFPDRDTVASKIATFGVEDQSWLKLLLENVQQDENTLEGLNRFLDQQSQAPFLNTLKLEKCGLWFGENTPARLQIRLHEISKSSQHAAFTAFRAGLVKSGGLEKAYPASPL